MPNKSTPNNQQSNTSKDQVYLMEQARELEDYAAAQNEATQLLISTLVQNNIPIPEGLAVPQTNQFMNGMALGDASLYMGENQSESKNY